MKRRTLVGGIAAAAAAAAAPGTASPRRIGMSDVDRLQKRFARDSMRAMARAAAVQWPAPPAKTDDEPRDLMP